jgi:hypothetical protein
MRLASRILLLSLVLLLATSVIAMARSKTIAHPVLMQGTDVLLAFDQSLSSKTAQVGQNVKLSVLNDVYANGVLVIRRGTPVIGVISEINKRKNYGVNATMRIALNPIRAYGGQMVQLEPRTKGNMVAGKKSGQAAGATVGGAAILGPVGLAGGYFIHGKSVNIRAGDELATEVTRDIRF